MEIGSKIKKFREFRSFTQDYMAEKLQITQAGYSKIERNEVDVPFSRLEKIAKILDIKLEDIISFDEKFIFNNHLNNYNNITNGYVIGDKSVFIELQKLYESRIDDLQNEIIYLRGILEKALAK